MPTPYTPLSDAAWEALRPLLPAPGAGRPIENLRARFDALFAAVTSGQRWSHYTAPGPTPTETLHRHFRRLTHAGLWTRLLTALADPNCPPAIKAITHAIHGAYRRTIRLLGLPAIILARRLGHPQVLPGPPSFFPDPDLSETIQLAALPFLKTASAAEILALIPPLRAVIRTLAGRKRLPRACRYL